MPAVQSGDTFNSTKHTFDTLLLSFNGILPERSAETNELKRATRVQDYLGIGTPLQYR